MTERGQGGGDTGLVVVALGGNAMITSRDRGDIDRQMERSRDSAEHIAGMIESGTPVVLTHGNGPIVGNILIRNEAARALVPPMPLDICGADSQGGIGYMVQQTLGNELRRRGIMRPVVSVITQVVVDPADPAFQHPTKPIGPFYTHAEADGIQREKRWIMHQDAGRGWRRVVPSPEPREIVEREVIGSLVAAGVVVIAVGGGGIPVIREANGSLRGVEAVIDKDRAAAVLARDLGARRMMILTAVPAIYRDFGTPMAAPIARMTLEEAAAMIHAGVFDEGSMGPKVEAAVTFLRSGGDEVVIASLEDARAAAAGEAGTRIVRAGAAG